MCQFVRLRWREGLSKNMQLFCGRNRCYRVGGKKFYRGPTKFRLFIAKIKKKKIFHKVRVYYLTFGDDTSSSTSFVLCRIEPTQFATRSNSNNNGWWFSYLTWFMIIKYLHNLIRGNVYENTVTIRSNEGIPNTDFSRKSRNTWKTVF